MTKKKFKISGKKSQNAQKPALIPDKVYSTWDNELVEYRVSFKIKLPRVAHNGFFKKLISLGFYDVTVTKTPKSTYNDYNKSNKTAQFVCPLGYKVDFPFCGKLECVHCDDRLGCQYTKLVTDGKSAVADELR